MIKALFETHINVSDYEASSAFYERLPGLIPLHEDAARKSKFYWIGRPGEAMLPDEPRPELAILSWPEWEKVCART